jgi:predicted homoserine dehydrogenase-like protein
MDRGLANHILNTVPGMKLVAVSDRTLASAKLAYVEHGAPEPLVATSQGQLENPIRSGKPVITEDANLLVDSDNINCLVDVTGAVEFGAVVTMRAIERKKHMVTMNAELDGTVGPLLKKYAEKAGVVLTGSDGDQPGVQLNLWRFVKGLGVTPLVCGNIKGLQDEHRNPTTQKGFAEKWGQNPYMVTSFADGTKISFEQAIVANATGMTVQKRGMVGREHAGHIDELTKMYDVKELQKLGGVVDYVVKSLPSPGVFVLGTHDDPKQRHYLNLYKLGEGPLYSFYTPYHLCHFEVPNSVARAVLFNDGVIQPVDGPKVDVITTSKIALKAGEVIVASPQGTIPRGPAFFDPELKGRWGAARLAQATGAPVVPVGLWGTEKVWPRSSRLPAFDVSNRPVIRVRVGDPVPLKHRSLEADTKRIMAALVDLLPPEARIRRTPTDEELRATFPPGYRGDPHAEYTRRPGTDT